MSLITRSRWQPTPELTTPVHDASTTPRGGRLPKRPNLSGTLTALAGLLVFGTLVVPDQLGRLTSEQYAQGALLRIPLEGILGAAILMALPPKARRATAMLLGAGLGLLGILKIINMGFRLVLGRRFNPVLDWTLFGDGYNYLVETSGRAAAVGTVIVTIVAGVALLAVMTLAVLRLAGIAARHRRPATRAVAALVPVWIALALIGSEVVPGMPIASDNVAILARNTVLTVPGALADRKAFAAAAQADSFRGVPADQLLSGLRGQDVVIGVVESYGRSVLEDPRMAAVIDPALAAGTQQLAAAGFAARSGFLTSSTYGGSSWLAHASFQSGLWIDNPDRYRQLVSGDRLTLTRAFQTAGWHTVGVEPGNTHPWPEAKFYGYNEVWDSRNLGYQGPRFGWSRMPDQFTLAAFQQNVYSQKQGPLMAEITLTSSHEPWTPTPQLVDWNAVGDGTVFGPMAAAGENRSVLLKDKNKVRIEYAKSVAYSMSALISWAQTYGDDDLVLVLFGDHQPTANVSGKNASHDVPITIVAKNPAVLDRIAGWGWQDGLKPDPKAPVWKMDAFRDRFLTAFSTPTSPAR